IGLVVFASGVVGTMQWLCLRRWVRRASLWVLAWVVGVSISVAIFVAIPRVSPAGFENVSVAIMVASSGLTLGAITGITLIVLLREKVFLAQSSVEAEKGNRI